VTRRASDPAFRPDPSTARGRDALVVVLTLTTGAVDAVTYLRLGKVFSSVITGNLALLGVSAGQHDATLALNGGLALAGYGTGVLLGMPLARTPERGQPPWPMRVTATLSAELALLVAFSALWLVSGAHRGTSDRLALLMIAAAAMGMQSTAVRRLGQMSTTYLTSTLTGVLSAFALIRVPSEWPRSVGVLAAMVTGAVLGALAAVRSPGWVPAAVLAPLAAVLACSLPLAGPTTS
jgi:uncharacterized membrane protein YoaK (UPF0700 family)